MTTHLQIASTMGSCTSKPTGMRHRVTPFWLAFAITLIVLLGMTWRAVAVSSSPTGAGYGGAGGGYMFDGYVHSTNNIYDRSVLCVPDGYVCCTGEEDGDGAEGEEDCEAMPRWRVTEPLLNLWLVDRPLWYQPSRGPQISFDLFFKNIQGTNGAADNGSSAIFGIGTNWHTKWRAYVSTGAGYANNLLVFLGDGSARTYTVGQVDYNTRLKLEAGSPGYVLTAPNGAAWRFTNEFILGGVTNWFLTTREDAHGNAVRFQYAITHGTSILLTNVVDVDGTNTVFEYTNSGPYSFLISKVTGPGSRTSLLSYDTTGHLTNIVDMGGLGSGLFYDSTNNMRQLTTPYGPTLFSVWATATNWSALRISEVGLRTNFWMYLDQGTNLPTDYTASAPTLDSPLVQTWDTNDCHMRNSFFWTQRGIEQLSANVRTNLLGELFDPNTVTTNDFQLGRQRHWLRTAAPSVAIGRTLSFQRAPTPDGNEAGQITWYDHEGKPSGTNWMEGVQFLPRCVGWKLPDGSSRYTFLNRNPLGFPTNSFETYQTSGMLRSNRFEYAANGIDLTRHVRYLADGSERRVATNVYNASHLVVSNWNALDELTFFTYDGSNRLTTVTRPTGLFTTNVYDANGRLSQVIELTHAAGAGLRTNSYTWTNGLVLTHTDPRDASTTNTYDALSRITMIRDGRGTNKYEYDRLDLIRSTDRGGDVRSNLFDSLRRLVRHVDARNNTNSFVYCSCGALSYATNALGQSTLFTYDHQARRTTTFHPGNYNVTNTWNAMGELVRVSDNGGYRVTNSYNQQGLLTAADTAHGRLFSRTYDIEDNLVSATDANGVTVTNVFDPLRRNIARGLSATNSVEGFTWSPRGLLTYTNPASRITNSYDELGRKTMEINANGETNQFAYAPGGELLTLTDAKRQVTTWTYDLYGRVTNKQDNLGTNLFRYLYDLNDRMTNRWTPGTNATVGINTRYVLDGNNNVTLVTYLNATNSMAYDALNRVTNMVDAVGTTRYAYSAAGLLESEDGPWDSDTVSYTYTTGRQRSALTLLQPNATAWQQSYAYDLARRLTNTTSPAGVFRYEYTTTAGTTPGRLVHKLTLGNGAYITNGYDGVARLMSTVLKHSSHGILNVHEYQVNAGHQRTKQTRRDGDYVDYTYDAAGQLIGAFGKEAGGANRLHEQLGYAYDPAGNLQRRTNNALVQSFAVNSLNQLSNVVRSTNFTLTGFTTGPVTNVAVNAVKASNYLDRTFAKENLALVDGNNTFTAIAQDNDGRADTNALTLYLPATNNFVYDLNGNLRTNGTRIFDYDDENQLTRITEPGAWRSDFAYDGILRLRKQLDFTWNGLGWSLTNEVRFIHDGNVPIQERDGFNLPLLTLTRGLENALLALSESAKQSTGGSDAHAYYHADGNANITAMTDGAQRIAARYLYDPYGNTLLFSGIKVFLNRYRFLSSRLHELSEGYNLLSGWYHPTLQRFGNSADSGLGGSSAIFVLNALILSPVVVNPVIANPVIANPIIATPRPILGPFNPLRPGPVIEPPPIPPFVPRPVVPPPPPPVIPKPIIPVPPVVLVPPALANPNPNPEPQPPPFQIPPNVIFHPKDPACHPDVECHWTGVTQEPVPGVVECQYECKDGSTVWKTQTRGGACKDTVHKNDPYISCD